jgi:hypothetical protein
VEEELSFLDGLVSSQDVLVEAEVSFLDELVSPQDVLVGVDEATDVHVSVLDPQPD